MCVAEQSEQLACEYEIHLCSERVEDVNLTKIHWHRVPTLPGPHLAGYLWRYTWESNATQLSDLFDQARRGQKKS
jgi:hypothetical protein